MNDRGQFEIVTGADGRELIRIPASVLGAPPEEISALRAEIAELKKAQSENGAIKFRPGIDAGARETTTRALEAFTSTLAKMAEAADRQSQITERLTERLVCAFNETVRVISEIKPPSISVSPTPVTFAPNILPAEVHNVVTVLAQLPPRSTRTATITTDANGTQSIVLDAAS